MTKRKIESEQATPMVPDEYDEARAAVALWERETLGERWTVKRMTVAALFALLWALLVEVRALRWQQRGE